jgi:hypothetical protein
MSEIISRAEAKAAGMTRYFTGKPCPKGHVAERIVSSRACLECDREKIAEYRERNPDRRIAYSAFYYEANRDQIRAAKNPLDRAYYEANKDKVLAQKAAYREANRDKVLAQKAAYYAANKDKHKAAQDAWVAANREKVRAIKAKYRAKRRAERAAAVAP